MPFWRTSVKCVAFHDIPLHTEKPPYRFPHTAADCLFAEQIAVRAGAGQRQHHNIILYAIDKQPVRENMTLPMTCPIAGQVMVTVLIRQRFAHCQQCYDLLQQLNLQACLLYTSRKMFRYKAFYSLDCNDGIENAAIGWAQPSP